MNRRAFDELNGRHRVEGGRYFHQRSLRQVCPLPSRFGLCAALVELWWKERDALDRLRVPNAEMVRDLVRRQARHAYLTELPADTSAIGAEDRALLELKYGDLRVNSLDADLEALHDAALAESHAWTDCLDAPPVDGRAEVGLRLMLLRYREGGHRMAFAAEHDGRRRFFDPNAGEVVFAGAAEFGPWFGEFWHEAGYGRRYPDVTVYRFTTRAAAETAVRGS
jgi:hypothetical protein